MSRLSGRSAVVLTLVAVLGLTGCTAPSPDPATPTSDTAASVSPTSAGGGSSAAPSSAAPVGIVPGGSAAQNLPFFSQVVAGVWSGSGQTSGRAYVDALTAAGFDKGAMQVTADESTIGNPAESIEFSVRVGDECLVGQVGPSIGNPVTAVLPALSSGGCLIGQTRAIDW